MLTHDTNAIRAEGLVKRYPGGVVALDGLSFSVAAGTVFGLLGPNGAGKSTTVKVLTTLSWLLSLVVSAYYVFHAPNDGFKIRKNIWDQNYLYPTAFTLNSVIVNIYW